MTEVFNVSLHVSNLQSSEEILSVLSSVNAFKPDLIHKAVEILGRNQISMKKLLMMVEMAREAGDQDENSYISIDNWSSVLLDLTAAV